jgi:hypothetical protein
MSELIELYTFDSCFLACPGMNIALMSHGSLPTKRKNAPMIAVVSKPAEVNSIFLIALAHLLSLLYNQSTIMSTE